MSEQIFISYRRDGGDIYARAICDALRVRGYTVFYDFDSLHGGYFDERIYKSIEECNDFVLVLPPNSLDRCVNENDWVRLEIKHALQCGKNIIPILLPGFSFPENIPKDIVEVKRYNGVPFVMAYFDAVIDAVIKRLTTVSTSSEQKTNAPVQAPSPAPVTTPEPAPANTPKTPKSEGDSFDDIMSILRGRKPKSTSPAQNQNSPPANTPKIPQSEGDTFDDIMSILRGRKPRGDSDGKGRK